MFSEYPNILVSFATNITSILQNGYNIYIQKMLY